MNGETKTGPAWAGATPGTRKVHEAMGLEAGAGRHAALAEAVRILSGECVHMGMALANARREGCGVQGPGLDALYAGHLELQRAVAEAYDPARNVDELDRIPVPEELRPMRDLLARNMAARYAAENPGSDAARPWDELDGATRRSNTDTADRTIRVLLREGYRFVLPGDGLESVRMREVGTVRPDGSGFTVSVVDVSGIPEDQAALIDAASERAMIPIHDGWSKDRLRDGFRYAEATDKPARLHADLVPYENLTEAQKAWDKLTAKAALEALVAAGARLEPPAD